MCDLAGFIPLPLKIGIKSCVVRYLFAKKHEANDSVKPSERTLYVVNVPQYIDQECLKFIFKNCGGIENIYILSKPKSNDLAVESKTSKYFSPKNLNIGCMVAYVVFQKPFSVEKALQLQDVNIVPGKLFYLNIGKKHWCSEYNSKFVNANEVKKEIELYMVDYDSKTEKEKQKAKEMDGVADEQGWITVTKHSKKPKIPRTEAVSNKLLQKESKERAKKTLLNFYKSQLRESKMEHLIELRKKFEKDKERIALMKANRKFKPF